VYILDTIPKLFNLDMVNSACRKDTVMCDGGPPLIAKSGSLRAARLETPFGDHYALRMQDSYDLHLYLTCEYDAEIKFWRRLLSYSKLTKDPAQADLIYVPAFPFNVKWCVLHDNTFKPRMPELVAAKLQADALVKASMDASPFRGSHFLVSSFNGEKCSLHTSYMPGDPAHWRDLRLVTFEDLNMPQDAPHGQGCGFMSDIVLPYPSDVQMRVGTTPAWKHARTRKVRIVAVFSTRRTERCGDMAFLKATEDQGHCLRLKLHAALRAVTGRNDIVAGTFQQATDLLRQFGLTAPTATALSYHTKLVSSAIALYYYGTFCLQVRPPGWRVCSRVWDAGRGTMCRACSWRLHLRVCLGLAAGWRQPSATWHSRLPLDRLHPGAVWEHLVADAPAAAERTLDRNRRSF
jgi:hypothetical protein